jgi:hypothetical protein
MKLLLEDTSQNLPPLKHIINRALKIIRLRGGTKGASK